MNNAQRQLLAKAVNYYNKQPAEDRTSENAQVSIFQFIYVIPHKDNSGYVNDTVGDKIYDIEKYYKDPLLQDPLNEAWKVTFQYIGASGEDIIATHSDIMILSSERLHDTHEVEHITFSDSEVFTNPDLVWRHLLAKGTYSPTRTTFITNMRDSSQNAEIDDTWMAVPQKMDTVPASGNVLFKIRPQFQMAQYVFSFNLNDQGVDSYDASEGLHVFDTLIPLLIDGSVDLKVSFGRDQMMSQEWKDLNVPIPIIFKSLTRDDHDCPYPRFNINSDMTCSHVKYTKEEYERFHQLHKDEDSMERRDGRYAFTLDPAFVDLWPNIRGTGDGADLFALDINVTLLVKQQFIGSDRCIKGTS